MKKTFKTTVVDPDTGEKLEGNEYTVAPIPAGVTKDFQKQSERPEDFAFRLVVESLRAGGDENAEKTAHDIPAGIFDPDSEYQQVLREAQKINGFKQAAKGEVPAGAKPANGEQTGPQSMDDSALVTDGDIET